MKKISVFFLTIAAAGAMFFAGCKKDVNTITLGVEVEPAAASGKLYIDANHNPVFFTSGEMVNVNGTEYPVTLDGTTYKVDVTDEGEGAIYRAAYPTSLFNTPSATGFTGNTNQPIHLSRWQKYVKVDGKQNVQLPAGAIINGDGSKKLKFYNFGSLLEIQWKNTSNVSYDIVGIEVTVPGVGLYGDGVANLSGNTSNIVMNDVKKNRVNLDITEEDRETVAAGGTSDKYYIFLPPFENKKVTVRIQTIRTAMSTLEDQKLRTVTVNTSSAVTLPRNYIVPMHVESTPTEDNGLTGYFSVRGDAEGNDSYKVVFSRGNLQHVETALPNTGTWKFADRQYDFFACNNLAAAGHNISTTTDLFAWSFDYSGDNTRDDKFGMFTYDYWNDFDDWTAGGTFQDWGYYKTISGDAPHTWFTMTSDEWFYLLHTRVHKTGDDLRGKAKITGIADHPGRLSMSGNTHPTEVYGFILLPDDWTPGDVPTGISFTPASQDSLYQNVYNISEWARLEAAGAMFLPAAGYAEPYGNPEAAEGSVVVFDNATNQNGNYWTSTKKEVEGSWASTYAESHYLAFQYNTYYWHLQTSSRLMSNNTVSNYDMAWYYMRSVRLVKPAPGYVDPVGRSTVNQ